MRHVIAQATVWEPMRCYAAGYVETPVCPFCGTADVDWRHQVWLCPVVKACEDVAIQKINNFVGEAAEVSATECFWLRSLVPWSWAFALAEKHVTLETFAKVWGALHNAGRVGLPAGAIAGSDGSGGEHSRDPRLRRVGWGLVLAAAAGGNQLDH